MTKTTDLINFEAFITSMSKKNVLITGAAGFIGFHLARKLTASGYAVTGVDNLSDYYDVKLKIDRLEILKKLPDFWFLEGDITNPVALEKLFSAKEIEYVVNLAAQPGVRYSLTNPMPYVETNIRGFLNILEACRHNPVKHLIYASSSSVYGANSLMPFSVHHNVDHPLSLYAATKKANELMAHSYSSLFGIPTTGLRFFTVYGPYGRPDMALFMFTKAILEGRPVDIFNDGKMRRDFTYVDDIVEGVARLIPRPARPNPAWDGKKPDPGSSFAPYRIFNIGNNQPVELLEFIAAIEDKLGKKAVKNFLPLQEGDVPATFADVEDLMREVGFKPSTPVKVGIDRFIDWYLDYYSIRN